MPGSNTQNFRENWIDGARGVAIVLVVVGHQISSLSDAGLMRTPIYLKFVHDWIYTFHVPVFFFISGMFIARSLRRSLSEFILDKTMTIVYPYFIWSFLTLFVKSIVGDSVHNRNNVSDFYRIFYNPIDQFWFLFVLFLLYVLYAVQIKLGFNRWLIILVGIALHPGFSPLPFPQSPPINEAGLFGIFMALGIAVGPELETRRFRRADCWFIIPIGYCAAALATSSSLSQVASLVVASACAGIMATIALSQAMEETRLGRGLQYLGRHSLEIYILHTFAAAGMRVVLLKIVHVDAAVPHFILGAISGIGAPLAIVWAFERVGFLWAFRLPTTFFASAGSFSRTKRSAY